MRLNRALKVVLLGWIVCFVIAGCGHDRSGKEKERAAHQIGPWPRRRCAQEVHRGAKVFIRNVNKKTTTVLVTDENGLYAIYGLDPKLDYEVHAEHGKFVSEKKSISSFLERFDNVFNFELGSSTHRRQLHPARLFPARLWC